MELFYAHEVSGGVCYLDAEESGHCVRVLRHHAGDSVEVIDGQGTLYRCRLTDDNPKGASATIFSEEPGFGGHPYHLTLGCCPTKNNERFEWFVEKATELGVDGIVPLIGERSERRVYKTDRARRIALSATKQSLKARIPEIAEPVSVKEFISSCHSERSEESLSFAGENYFSQGFAKNQFSPADGHSERSEESLRLIAYCFEDPSVPRISIQEALAGFDGREVTVLIGPEGDFSPEEAALALQHGYRPVHLGPSRLRTETAAAAVYLHFLHDR